MRRTFAILFALIAWFAVLVQLVLMIQNRITGIPETIVRFFSFFTILTNLMAALYFTGQVVNVAFTYRPGMLTAISVYIFIVGIVYQLLLRHIWNPTGMQRVVDELLHSVNPLLVILYWYLYEDKLRVRYVQIKRWLIYPLVYFVYIMARGSFSGFYPYPFVNVREIGLARTCINSLVILIFFVLIACLFIAIGRKTRMRTGVPHLHT